ncbi:hypothetical protein AWA2013_31370 (plasmid) [Lactiplantibacillus plantarum]|nr:hypothetical protein AWA2013_31370 [Lactiplantibacillus plantarum]
MVNTLVEIPYKLVTKTTINAYITVLLVVFVWYNIPIEKLRRWLFPIGGGAYGVNLISQPKIRERSSPSVRVGRFTTDVKLWDFHSRIVSTSC